MKQRVGCARAFAIEPKVLFHDEPFSALDVLTAENLRSEIDQLWNDGSFPSKSILLVTHNIEEAVFLADRVIVLGSSRASARRSEYRTAPSAQPFRRALCRIVDHLYTIMTNPDVRLPRPGQRPPCSRRLTSRRLRSRYRTCAPAASAECSSSWASTARKPKTWPIFRNAFPSLPTTSSPCSKRPSFLNLPKSMTGTSH